MATLQIYDKLLQFPLFQGMSRDDLEIIAGHTRFGFLKVASGRPVVKSGEACTQLYFLSMAPSGSSPIPMIMAILSRSRSLLLISSRWKVSLAIISATPMTS